MSDLRDQNILFFLRGTQHGGTENVVLQLCQVLLPKVNKIVVCSADGIRTAVLDELKIRHYVLPDIGCKTFPVIAAVLQKMQEIIRKENITIVHTHHRMAALYAYILSKNNSFLFLNTCHNTFYDKRYLTRLAYKHAHLIACGEKVKENLMDFFKLSGSQIAVIHNSVNSFPGPVVENPYINHLKSDGFFVIANVGRLSEQKGMGYYLRAIPAIIEKHPKTRFLIIGSGEEEKNLQQLCDELHIGCAICFMGYRTDVQNILSQVDLVVLSSLWEGFPLTPIEAFSVGKTIVATAVDGTVEIVKNGETGLLVKPRSSSEIADKVNWMIEHPQERRRMEASARTNYEKQFSFDQFSRSYCKYYQEVCRCREIVPQPD